MSDVRRKLVGLLDYVEQVARLEERVAFRLADYRLPDGSAFSITSADARDLPGVTLDGSDDDGPVWLEVERLAPSEPPAPPEIIADWIAVSSDPRREPEVRRERTLTVNAAEKKAALASGDVRPENIRQLPRQDGEPKKSPLRFDMIMALDEEPEVKAAVDAYVAETWTAWSVAEVTRRRANALHAQLARLVQMKEFGAAGDTIELVVGIGVVRWQKNGTAIERPLIERRVEIEIDRDRGGVIRVRPTGADASVDLRPFEALGCARLPALANLLRRDIQRAGKKEGVSPFLRESFEAMLQAAATRLDPNGTFAPEATAASLNGDSARLTITGEWVLFARPRSRQTLLQDIEALRDTALSEDRPVEGLAARLVSEPPLAVAARAPDASGQHAPPQDIPAVAAPTIGDLDKDYDKEFGDGADDDDDEDWDEEEFMRSSAPEAFAAASAPAPVAPVPPAADAPEIFFPKPFNDEQIAICRALATADGLVVQGPPGTGKTHTIANLVSHAMATGQRVLVVSRAERALASLRDELPAEIRPLAVSLLSGERDGWRQLEGAIREVQSDDEGTLPGKRRAAIARLELQHSQLRERVKAIDSELEGIASAHLSRMGPRKETPVELAQRIAAERDAHDWFTDRPVRFAQDAGFTDDDLAALADARRKAGDFLDHLDAKLPAAADMPDADRIVSWHNALIAASRQDDEAARGPAKTLHVSAANAVEAQELAQGLDDLAWTLRIAAEEPWIAPFREGALTGSHSRAGLKLQDIASAFDAIERRRATLRGRAIELPTSLSDDRERELTARWAEVIKETGALLEGREKETLTLARKLIRACDKAPRLRGLLAMIAGASPTLEELARDEALCAGLARQLRMAADAIGLASVGEDRRRLLERMKGGDRTSTLTRQFVGEAIGNPDIPEDKIRALWGGVLQRLDRLQALGGDFETIARVTGIIAAAGAPAWARKLSTETAKDDEAVQDDWREAWDNAAARANLERIDVQGRITGLADERADAERQSQELFCAIIRERTFYELGVKLSAEAKAALGACVRLMDKGERPGGKTASAQRRKLREAMAKCRDAVACWIMPTWRVADALPAELGAFDLVILDEASQSGVTDLPALMRGRKVLVLGDDRQPVPAAPFATQEEIAKLRERCLGDLSATVRRRMEPGESLQGLMQTVFPAERLMLKEHFRCVEPIIRFSMPFYGDELLPLRIAAAQERLDPPLVDIYVPHGARAPGRRVNAAEAEIIVDEIKALAARPETAHRSVGVVSLMGPEQAEYIRARLTQAIGEDAMRRHAVLCGDGTAFQGSARDIVYLSMVTCPATRTTLTAAHHARRFNVAVASAKDRLVLVRSVRIEELEPDDLRARLIAHFENPMPEAAEQTDALLACETDFERDLMERLLDRGYRVQAQLGVGGTRIDMVVEGANGARLAIACDGDRFDGPGQWREDMRRQRALERAGWRFWRCFALTFYRNADAAMADLVAALSQLGIEPQREDDVARERGAWTEHRTAAADLTQAEAPVVPEAEAAASSRNGTALLDEAAGIEIGDRLVLAFADDGMRLSVTLTEDDDDLAAGKLSARSPAGRVLLGADQGEEIDLDDDDGTLRRVLIESIDKRAPRAVAKTPELTPA